MPPTTSLPIARERFTGSDTLDIDGRTPDGGGDPSLAVGEWLLHPTANGGGGTLGIGDDSLATRKVGLAYGNYADYPLTGIPALPAVQRAEVTVNWPRRDADDPGGPLYCAFTGSPLRPGDPNPSTVPLSSGHSTVTVFMKWVGGSGSATIDAELSDGTHAVVEITITSGGLVTQYISYIQFWGDPVTHDEVGSPGPTYTAPARCIQIGIDCNASLVEKRGPTGGTTTSRPSSVTVADYTYSVSGGLELDNVEGTAPPGEDQAFENAWVDATLRHDPAVETCYQATAEFDHSDVTPTVEYTLWYVSAGSFREMRSIAAADWEHDVPHTHSLEIDANNVLRVYRGTEELTDLAFDLNTDVADEDGDPVPILTTGDPAVDVADFSFTGFWMELRDFTVYIEAPCEGGEDNPYPWDPPPPGPSPALEWDGYYRWINGLPRQICHEWLTQHAVPHKVIGPEIPPEEIRRYFRALGLPRASRSLCTDFDGDTIPEPDTPFPPFHDPCYIVPPIDPGPVLPLTGRFFGPSNTPLGALGPLFNGTQKALGGWYNNDLPAVAAKDCTLVGAQGSSAVLKGPGGTWDLGTFINGTRAKLAPLYSLLLTYTASGHFFGYSMIDDMESSVLWKPNGVPTGELATAVATIRSEFPGIRLGARVRPSTSGGDAGLDFYTAQYVAKQDAPFSWGVREYSLARSRGAYVILSINLLHGGDGSSGIRYMNGTIKGQSNNNWECSAAEVYEYYSQMYAGALSVDGTAEWLAGSLGYQYHPAFLARPGMLDAFAAARNELALLPPLS